MQRSSSNPLVYVKVLAHIDLLPADDSLDTYQLSLFKKPQLI